MKLDTFLNVCKRLNDAPDSVSFSVASGTDYIFWQ